MSSKPANLGSQDQNQAQSQNQNNKPDNATSQLVSLEDDDEFEDFPAQDWDDADTELEGGVGATGENKLWEEHWDDDDADDDFSARLKQELQAVQSKNAMQE